MKNNVIKGFMKKYWSHYVIGILFLIINAYIQSLTPRVLGIIVDLLKESVINSEKILLYLGLLILVAVFAFITRYIWRYYIMGNARNLESYLRQELFKHFQKLSVEFYNNRKTGDLIAYAINDINAVRMSFGPGVALIVNSLGISTVAIISMIGGLYLMKQTNITIYY